ncbi:MAG: V-type ATP synthase subunit B, partial [Thaumarchaeota archaeon]|nr:V-type ATP synthase subunit B [Nitrososphaerota archaeon]
MSSKNGSSGVEYSSISEIKGPLIIVKGVSQIAYDELVEVESNGEKRLGKVLDVGHGIAVVQVFEGTSGLSIVSTRARFLGKTMEIPVSQGMLGRIFDGIGKARDGLPEPIAEDFRDINGLPINPDRRDYPTDFIQTGISAIDGMNTLVRGQKLPIFSGAGLPHNALAAQIARQATVPGKTDDFAVVFAAIGVQNDEARFFQKNLEESGAMKRSTLFLN